MRTTGWGVSVEPAGSTPFGILMGVRIKDLKVNATGNTGRVEIADLTASVGAVSYPSGGRALDTLLLAADAALYEAKRTGRNRTCLAPPERDGGGGGVPTNGRLPRVGNPE
jgi:hypothetical protein